MLVNCTAVWALVVAVEQEALVAPATDGQLCIGGVWHEGAGKYGDCHSVVRRRRGFFFHLSLFFCVGLFAHRFTCHLLQNYGLSYCGVSLFCFWQLDLDVVGVLDFR